jgi:hypothetical protein
MVVFKTETVQKIVQLSGKAFGARLKWGFISFSPDVGNKGIVSELNRGHRLKGQVRIPVVRLIADGTFEQEGTGKFVPQA